MKLIVPFFNVKFIPFDIDKTTVPAISNVPSVISIEAEEPSVKFKLLFIVNFAPDTISMPSEIASAGTEAKLDQVVFTLT